MKGESGMRKCGRLLEKVRCIREASLSELEEALGKWIDLPLGFGSPVRRRIFSPLTNLLVVPFSGSLC
jgi:hypothetical protein